MPTIEVDLVFFLVSTVIAVFALPLIIGLLVWKSYRNPEFWLKLKRQGWVYALVLNALDKLVQVVIPLAKIGSDGEIRLFGNRTYFWPNMSWITRGKNDQPEILPDKNKPKPPEDPYKDTAGQRIIQWRNNKPAILLRWNDPFAQVWKAGNTISSITDPGMIDDISEMKALRMMMNADSITKLMQVALVVSIIGIVAIGGIAFAVWTQSASVDHLSCILKAGSNATIAAACH